MKHTKLDMLPNIEHVIVAAEQHNNALGQPNLKDWNRDQKPDFYLGMFSGHRVFQSAVITLIESATSAEEKDRLEWLQTECMLRLGEIANIIMDKYDLKGFKV